jgi:hypothetical protein
VLCISFPGLSYSPLWPVIGKSDVHCSRQLGVHGQGLKTGGVRFRRHRYIFAVVTRCQYHYLSHHVVKPNIFCELGKITIVSHFVWRASIFSRSVGTAVPHDVVLPVIPNSGAQRHGDMFGSSAARRNHGDIGSPAVRSSYVETLAVQDEQDGDESFQATLPIRVPGTFRQTDIVGIWSAAGFSDRFRRYTEAALRLHVETWKRGNNAAAVLRRDFASCRGAGAESCL